MGFIWPRGLSNRNAYVSDIGDGSTNPITVTHNLGTRDIIVMLREAAGSFTIVDAASLVSTTNTVQITFDTIPTSGQYRAIIFAASAYQFTPSYAATLSFANGDTLKRFTVSNSAVVSTSKIVGNIRRPNTANDSADFGYLFIANIVNITTGSFDLLVAVTDGGLDDVTRKPPLGSVEFHYQVA